MQPRPGPAGVGDQQRRDDQGDRLDHAVRGREPQAPLGDQVTGQDRDGQQTGPAAATGAPGSARAGSAPARPPARTSRPPGRRARGAPRRHRRRPPREQGERRRPAEGSIGVRGHPTSLGYLACPALDFDTSRGFRGTPRSRPRRVLGWRHVGLRAHRPVLRGRRVGAGPTRVHRVRRRRPLGGPPARTADAAPDAPAAGPGAGRRGAARGHPRPARATVARTARRTRSSTR